MYSLCIIYDRIAVPFGQLNTSDICKMSTFKSNHWDVIPYSFKFPFTWSYIKTWKTNRLLCDFGLFLSSFIRFWKRLDRNCFHFVQIKPKHSWKFLKLFFDVSIAIVSLRPSTTADVSENNCVSDSKSVIYN